MSGALVAGLLAGYGVAVPVGAIAPLLVGLSARHGLRVGAAAALGVASADGLYALVAVVGGAALADAVAPAATPLHLVAGAVLLAYAIRTAVVAARTHRRSAPASAAGRPRTRGGSGHLATTSAPSSGLAAGDGPGPGEQGRLATPGRAYAGLFGLTALNPATVVYFVAYVLGDRRTGGGAEAAVFVVAVVVASASWQLALAGGGAALGRVLTSERGRLVTALVSSLVVAALAARLLIGG